MSRRTETTPPARKRVLVVEDDDDVRRIFREWLKYAGFDVSEASDGLTALHIIESAPPDVVVLDIRLPTLDGVSVAEEIAANSKTRDIPVVVVSGGVVDSGRITARYVLRKPVTHNELLAAVRSSVATSLGRKLGFGGRQV